MMNQPFIVSLGEVLWDLFPDGERFGGAPANFACHAALGGATVKMVSSVGDDVRGQKAIGVLENLGVEVSLLQVAPGTLTGAVGIELDGNGKPTYSIHEDSAWDSLQWCDELGKGLRDAEAVYFGTLGQRSEVSRKTIRRCVETARGAGVPRILDVNLRAPYFDDEMIRESIELATILKLSDEELSPIAAAFGISSNDSMSVLRALLDQGSIDLVVMTRGADGALLVSPDETVDQPGIPTDVLDTVGAGDAFTATFLLGILAGERIESVLKRACEYAAEVCCLSGAVPSLPIQDN